MNKVIKLGVIEGMLVGTFQYGNGPKCYKLSNQYICTNEVHTCTLYTDKK